MLFTFDIAVIANTSKSIPKEQSLLLAPGIISWVSVTFPPGCHDMVKCVILHHEHQIFPSRDDESLSGNAFPIEWTEYYEMYQSPYDLKARLWSPNTTYNHTVTIRIAVLPRKAIIPFAIIDAIKSIFGILSPKRIFTRRVAE